MTGSFPRVRDGRHEAIAALPPGGAQRRKGFLERVHRIPVWNLPCSSTVVQRPHRHNVQQLSLHLSVGPAADWVRQPGHGGWTKGHRRRRAQSFRVRPWKNVGVAWTGARERVVCRGLPPRCPNYFPMSAGNTGCVLKERKPSPEPSELPGPDALPPREPGPAQPRILRAPAGLRRIQGVSPGPRSRSVHAQLVLLVHGRERWQ